MAKRSIPAVLKVLVCFFLIGFMVSLIENPTTGWLAVLVAFCLVYLLIESEWA